MHPELAILDLPNVQFLPTVAIHLLVFWWIDSLPGRTPLAQAAQVDFVGVHKVLLSVTVSSLFNFLLEGVVPANCIAIALLHLFLFFRLAVIYFLLDYSVDCTFSISSFVVN